MSRIFQIIWVTTGIILVLVGVNGLNDMHSKLARLNSLPTESPICLPINLSAQGIYSGCYRRDFASVMDDQLRLVVSGLPSVEETKKLLSGLSAMMVLKDDSGGVVSEQVVGAMDFHEWKAWLKNGLVLTLCLDKVRHSAGKYYLSIEVKTPADGMAGHPHCIVAEYALTGMENIIFSWIGLPIYWTMLLLGIIILIVRRRKRESNSVLVHRVLITEKKEHDFPQNSGEIACE